MRTRLKQSVILILVVIFPFLGKAQEADPQKALSLARVRKNDRIHIIQVNKTNNSGIEGLDLSEYYDYYTNNVFDLIENIGYNVIASDIPKISGSYFFKATDVLTPVDATCNTIAAATNYPEHKEETHVKINPVLFPKIIDLSSYVSTIHIDSKEVLLDYEAEMAVVYSKDVHRIEDLNNQLLGFMVAIDYSDRARMFRVYDRDHPELAVGFTNSKSLKGYFPVGPIIVIPKNWQTYYNNLSIQLYRNNIIKQSDIPNNMIWDIPRITEEALKKGDRKLWMLNNNKVELLPKGYIEKGTIALTGTPGGVVFEPPSKSFIINRAVKYTLLLRFFKYKPEEYVREEYLKKQYKRKKFLQTGELVKASITNLGNIHSIIQLQAQ